MIKLKSDFLVQLKAEKKAIVDAHNKWFATLEEFIELNGFRIKPYHMNMEHGTCTGREGMLALCKFDDLGKLDFLEAKWDKAPLLRYALRELGVYKEFMKVCYSPLEHLDEDDLYGWEWGAIKDVGIKARREVACITPSTK